MGSTMDKTQRRIMMFLPIIFITFVAQFPMGPILYWMTTNLWTVGQGLVTRRLVPKPNAVAPAAAGPKRSSRTPAKAESAGGNGAAAAEAERPAAPPPQSRRVKKKKGGARR